MIIELDCLMIERKGFELIIEKEVHSFFIEFESQAFQEGYVVIYQFIIL
jgi:hypothetical protein